MIQFVWIIIQDTPVAGMRFIKISNDEERERLEKFYGWLSGPVSEFSGTIQNIIIENTKYWYHSQNEVLFIVGTNLDETGIASIFIPELENQFFQTFDQNTLKQFNGEDISLFRKFDSKLHDLVKAFDKRKVEAKGKRKNLDAFEVLNLPSELQMVALVLVKLQVVTPEMISQVSGIPADKVERQLREIYQHGYLYITTISDKSYFSIKPFGMDETATKFVPRDQRARKMPDIMKAVSQGETVPSEDLYDHVSSEQQEPASKTPASMGKQAAESTDGSTAPSIPVSSNEAQSQSKKKPEIVESAMMAPPSWKKKKESQKQPSRKITGQSLEPLTEGSLSVSEKSAPIEPRFDGEQPTQELPPKLIAEKNLPYQKGVKLESTISDKRQKATVEPGIGEGTAGIKLKDDVVAQEIDSLFKEKIIIPTQGLLPDKATRRERGFITKRIKTPKIKKSDPFLLNRLFSRNLERLIEALFLGDFIVLFSSQSETKGDKLCESLFDTFNLLTPHRELVCERSDLFVHPKDADVVYVPKSLLKYYSWATIIDIDERKIIGGDSSDFSKMLVKKIRRIKKPKEFMKEITSFARILMKLSNDINTLKMESRSPGSYLDEVKKTHGTAILNAGLALSERTIRLQKDTPYIVGYYLRKGLDIVVRALLTNQPVVVIGDDPLKVYQIITALAVFTPHKALEAQIWTTNFAGIDLHAYDIIGAQEGTDKLFKGAVTANLRSMQAFAGPRSKYLHSLLRKMWKHRSHERPRFIRDQIKKIITEKKRLIQEWKEQQDKKSIQGRLEQLVEHYGEDILELLLDMVESEEPSLVKMIKDLAQ
jgi:hypothetical protein